MSLLHEVAIGLIPGIGSSLTRQLVSYCGSAENVFRETKGKLKKIPGIGEVLASTIVHQNIFSEAEKQLQLAEKTSAKILFYTHPEYPERLKHISDAPTLLYYKGITPLNSRRMLAIVGTRKATPYGKEMVEKLISELIPYDVVIVSGLAYGIDVAAHKAALSTSQPTIGAMASGLDVIYPSAHKSIAQEMLQQGGLITEYAFGTKPDAPHFPARNRIIAGMADAVIVAEAADTGGALITAEIANSYDREVFAIPGNLGNKYSEGCNKLIKQHKAHILTGVKDLEYIMNWSAEPVETASVPAASMDLSAFNTDEKEVITVLQENDTMLIDDLSWKSQIPVSKLASILLTLEFQGIVKSLPGKKFKLNLN